ncbi:hypothetical protein EDD86DRAFT_221112 [Gorgonomyces haynaldii]|nr:hypothetical protein EDD86DRAFT_221112 [Gorgonomyces haynaldii]
MAGNTLMRDLRSKNLTFPEFLDLFPHCQPSIQDLLQLLPPLAPRYYSCSSISKDTISFVFDVHPFGLCTNWLKSKVVGEAIPVFERDPRLSHFKMEDKPALMIGAGTGIAPFLSFLDSKQPKVLIYGHRTKQDAIHLEKIQQSDAVFYECLSKEESKYQYVYQVLPNLDPQVLESSVIYICGSLKMGKSVMDVLETIKPPEYWKERLLQKTLKRDVWG